MSSHRSTHSLLHRGHHATRHAALLIAKHNTKDGKIREGRGLQLEKNRQVRLTGGASYMASHRSILSHRLHVYCLCVGRLADLQVWREANERLVDALLDGRLQLLVHLHTTR